MPFTTDEIIPYQHPSWPSDSYMYFKGGLSQTDKDTAGRLSSVTEVDYDQDQAMVARSSGEKYRPKVEIVSPMSTRTAFVLTQLVDWEGSEFVVPVGAQDGFGNPHKLAGRKAPVTPYWVGKRPPEEMEDIDYWLNQKYGAMTEAQVERFRARREAAVRSARTEPGEDQSAPPDTDARLLAPARPAMVAGDV